MTGMYDDVGASAEAQRARIVLDRHESGPCPSCTPVGCPERVTAARVIAADRRRREYARAATRPW
ncbi:hypothetical protein [Micromonospora globbae]|uniref:hypothetical protein n=1 Tax=Micromonospora globbae TaxID=1894969 RepID=UPI00341D964B